MISNVFFKGELSNIAHFIITLVIISAATAISLSYDCLGIVLELNVRFPVNSLTTRYVVSNSSWCCWSVTFRDVCKCFSGCFECYTSHVHLPRRLLSEALGWPLVSWGKPLSQHHPGSGCLCNDNRLSHDGALPSGLFTRSRDVLLYRLQHLSSQHHFTQCAAVY